MPADCEIDNCGVLAIGRCPYCRRAYCGSHQGVTGTMMGVIPVTTRECVECLEKSQLAAFQAAEARPDASPYLEGSPAAKVLDAEIQRLAQILIERFPAETVPLLGQVRRSRLLRGAEWVNVEVARMWPIGTWKRRDRREVVSQADFGVTADGRTAVAGAGQAERLRAGEQAEMVPWDKPYREDRRIVRNVLREAARQRGLV